MTCFREITLVTERRMNPFEKEQLQEYQIVFDRQWESLTSSTHRETDQTGKI